MIMESNGLLAAKGILLGLLDFCIARRGWYCMLSTKLHSLLHSL